MSLLVFFLLVCLVADDVGATIFVNFNLTHCPHLVHPVNRELSLNNLLFPGVQLFLELLDLDVLLPDFRA